MKDINVLIRRAVEEWEQRNREMPAAIMPDGYKGEYLYRVPAKKMQQVPDIGIPAIFVPAGDRLPWVVVELVSDHELDSGNVDALMMDMRASGIICLGSIRLVSQHITLDRGQEG